ncbi:IS5 family transposase [uncultured Methylobacterium sp.]|uniref:IS5 family transposase n=1 Tax=uncultured Methylobacterium sp. TaxID=157278 RepID=UPI0035C95E79
MGRYNLTNQEWAALAPVPPTDVRGKERVDDRRVLNGIFRRLRTGAPWAEIPSRYAPVTTCGNRFRRWRKRGVWDRVLAAVSAAYDGDIQMIDATSVRMHQHAATAKKRRPIALHGSLARQPEHQDPRARSTRLSTPRAGPSALKLTEGQAHDRKVADDMLGGLGDGQILLGDRAYDSDKRRRRLAEQGAGASVRPMPNRKNVPAFSPFLYRYRNLVERFFSKIKHFRAIATRYDRDPENYLASVKLAAIRIWLRTNEFTT